MWRAPLKQTNLGKDQLGGKVQLLIQLLRLLYHLLLDVEQVLYGVLELLPVGGKFLDEAARGNTET